jgi:hypothetical protein
MQHTIRRARPARVVGTTGGLALAISLLAPGAAFATTTEPPVTTTTAPTPTQTTGSGTASATTTGSSPTSTATGSSTTGSPTSPSSTTSTGSTSPTTTGTPIAPSAPSAGRGSKVAAPSSKQVPFGGGAARIVPGTPTQQAGYAGGFIARTLLQGNHYNYPASEFFDGGNTIDAILALDGAKVGQTRADAAFAYLEGNVGGYTGTDFSSLYAGPAAKALLGAVVHGDASTTFGDDLLDALLNDSLGAAEPGRFSDLPVSGCGYDPCDNSNTLGQALALIAIGRATGDVPQEAVDFLLAQQCTDGGFRGSPDAENDACVSDTDATAFAAQALVGLSDPQATPALTFLSTRQAANGGFLNQDGQYNANTAGVAAQAFAAGGFTAQQARAQSFLAGLQLDCTAPAALRGGIAFTAADLATLKTASSTSTTYTAALDRAIRATPQATLGLAGGSLLTVTPDGAASTAPTLSCAATSTTTTTSSTTSTTPTSADPGTSSPPAGSATPGNLAFTGSNVAAMLLLALALLGVGSGALVIVRRKGAHA